MNYLSEIKAFYDWIETNSLSTPAIALWHALMHTNNRAGWITEFAVSISTLEAKTGLKKSAIIRSRNQLQQLGRIEFKARPGNQSTVYKIVPFENCVPLKDANRHTNATQTDTQMLRKPTPLIKLNKTKLNETNNKRTSSSAADDLDDFVLDSFEQAEPTKQLSNAFKVYEREGFGLLSSVLADKLGDMIDTYSDRWVCEALKTAVVQGKRNLSYVHGILKRWQADGIDEPWQQKRDKPKQTNTPANSYRPKFEVVKSQKGESMSEQELRELQELARKLDSEQHIENGLQVQVDDDEDWR